MSVCILVFFNDGLEFNRSVICLKEEVAKSIRYYLLSLYAVPWTILFLSLSLSLQLSGKICFPVATKIKV